MDLQKIRADALHALRLERKMEPEFVAEALGIEPAKLHRWEKGEELPTVEQEQELLTVLDADLTDLVRWMERLEIEGQED